MPWCQAIGKRIGAIYIIWRGLIEESLKTLIEDTFHMWNVDLNCNPATRFFRCFDKIWSHSLKPMRIWNKNPFGNVSCHPQLLIKSVEGEDAVQPLVIPFCLERNGLTGVLLSTVSQPFCHSKLLLPCQNANLPDCDLCDAFRLKSTSYTHVQNFYVAMRQSYNYFSNTSGSHAKPFHSFNKPSVLSDFVVWICS